MEQMDAPEWLAFLNRESRDRIYRLRVMTEPRDVRAFLAHRLEARFDFPLTSRLVCAVADAGQDDQRDWMDLVPLNLDPDGYAVLGAIRVTAGGEHARLHPGSVVVAEVLLDVPDGSGLRGRLVSAEPVVAVTA